MSDDMTQQEDKKIENKKISLPKISKNNLKVLVAVVLAALLGAGAYYLRGYFVAATVNGSPITRIAVIKELEKQGGKSVLDNLVTKKLIEQEAVNKNVTVSQEEIDNELSTIEQSTLAVGMTLEDALAQQNVSKTQLIEEIVLNKKLEKMVEGSVNVSDEEVTAYLEQNKETLPPNSDEETLKEQVRTSLRQQKLTQSVQDLLTTLRENAKINYYVTF
ncbi:hypothetical protein C4561_04440 [candidate division WWE3 bacterium]|jgi:foldase protein PrsA|uniref:PpiC domain-containing protein n=1 Tax=candidate division WWE3 bacterium TaxID=2053526 RepID=A0A3A4ZKB9_UNCKA|nr:MAG: hypothetical protein C4561_04440 [candidate division WWE3 bacterium]